MSYSSNGLYHKIQSSDGFIDYGEKFCSNLQILCRRLKKGEHFVVKKGNLEIRKHQSLFAKIKYFFEKKRVEGAVRSLITHTVLKLRGGGSSFQRLFFHRLAHLSSQIFDRRVITKEIAAALCPELLTTDRKERGATHALEQERKLTRRIQKTRLALKLGIGLELIKKGSCGAYFARDYKMKVVGVFKPGEEESLGSNSPKLLTKIRHFFMKYFLCIDVGASFWPNEGFLAEVMSSTLANALGIHILPPSKVVEFKNKGSFQIFAKNTELLDEVFGVKSWFGGIFLKCNAKCRRQQILKTLKQRQVEELALIDLAIANRDRHSGNLLVKRERDQAGKRDIVLIDHGLAFPRVNPKKGDYFYSRNQYTWAVLPNSALPFSDETVARAEKCFRGEGLERLLASFKAVNDQHGRGFARKTRRGKGREKGSSQELAFKERIAVLLICMQRKMTIRELAKNKSKEDLKAFLERHGIQGEAQLDQFLQIN